MDTESNLKVLNLPPGGPVCNGVCVMDSFIHYVMIITIFGSVS